MLNSAISLKILEVMLSECHKTTKRINKMNQVWSEGERNFIRENAGHLTDKQGAAKLSRLVGRNITVNAWRKQRQKMGISKKPGRGVCKVERKQ